VVVQTRSAMGNQISHGMPQHTKRTKAEEASVSTDYTDDDDDSTFSEHSAPGNIIAAAMPHLQAASWYLKESERLVPRCSFELEQRCSKELDDNCAPRGHRRRQSVSEALTTVSSGRSVASIRRNSGAGAMWRSSASIMHDIRVHLALARRNAKLWKVKKRAARRACDGTQARIYHADARSHMDRVKIHVREARRKRKLVRDRQVG
jgi:hypothetical protein